MGLSIRTRMLPFALLALLTTATGGCATMGGSSASVDTSVQSQLPPYNGPRARIRLAEFSLDAGGQSSMTINGPDGSQKITFSTEQRSQLTSGLKSLLKGSLLRTNRFYVLGREESFSTMKQEYSEGQEGWVQEEDQIEKGRVIGPDLVIKMKVTKWAPDAGGRSLGAGALLGGLLGGVKLNSKRSEVGLVVDVYDIRTSVLLASVNAEGVAQKKGIGLGGLGFGGGAALGGIFSQYENTPMEDAIAKAIQVATDNIALQVPQKYFRHS